MACEYEPDDYTNERLLMLEVKVGRLRFWMWYLWVVALLIFCLPLTAKAEGYSVVGAGLLAISPILAAAVPVIVIGAVGWMGVMLLVCRRTKKC